MPASHVGRPGGRKIAKSRKAPAKGAAKKATAKRAPSKKAAAKRAGRSGTAGKAEGSAPVRAYIAQLPAQQRAIAKRLDAIIGRAVPDVKRAIKWSSPIYGRTGNGWFCSFAGFKAHVGLNFFMGAQLRPPLPEGSGKSMRTVRFRSMEDLDEAQVESWVSQAAALPGWAS